MNKKVHIIAAHTDDEVLGVGATVSELTKKGYEFFVTILGYPIEGKYNLEKNSRDLEEIKEKRNLVKENVSSVAKILGIKDFKLHDFPNCQYDTLPQLKITQTIEKDMKEFNPSIVITHYEGDSNTDHKAVYRSAVIATRSLPNSPISKVLLAEVPSSTTYAREGMIFKPDTYIPISIDSLENKISAMEAYETEKTIYPHPRSPEALKALAMFRGSEIGVSYAEAFKTLWRKGI